MRFYFAESDTMTADDIARWTDTFADVVFACGECGSEQTTESDQLVPAGTMHAVRCEHGHVSVGLPPARFRQPLVATS